jgi:hypothetical protein
VRSTASRTMHPSRRGLRPLLRMRPRLEAIPSPARGEGLFLRRRGGRGRRGGYRGSRHGNRCRRSRRRRGRSSRRRRRGWRGRFRRSRDSGAQLLLVAFVEILGRGAGLAVLAEQAAGKLGGECRAVLVNQNPVADNSLCDSFPRIRCIASSVAQEGSLLFVEVSSGPLSQGYPILAFTPQFRDCRCVIFG